MDIIKPDILKMMIESGYSNLQNQKDYVDKLNVFPVPDGDTGTNMSLTLKSAVEKLREIDEISLEKIGDSITKGSLMGARGNSGVILSQILRGFGRSISTKEELNIKDLSNALDEARKVSYKAVIKPVEGTILTVIRMIATYANKNYKKYDDIVLFFEDIVDEGNNTLQDTPNMLKELKDANVVDSGGQGLMFFLEGMLKELKGEKLEKVIIEKNDENRSKIFDSDIHILDREPEFGYCTEFILHSKEISSDELKDKIISLGNSMVVVSGEDIVKVHIHSNNPGKVLEIAGEYGNLDRIKIDNMRLEYQERLEENQKEKASINQGQNISDDKKFAIISVATGKGISDIMKDFGVDVIIEGGQTMNPSTHDFIEAIDSVNKRDIIIFPNNSNIIMAANQAKAMSKKNVTVIPTKNIPQCLQGLISMDIFKNFDENVNNISNSFKEVKSGQVTYAVRDTKMDDIEIKKGDFIGLDEKNILSFANTPEDAAYRLIERMLDEDSEIISLFYGEDTDIKLAEELAKKIESENPDLEVEVYYGGQKIYNYLISIE